MTVVSGFQSVVSVIESKDEDGTPVAVSWFHSNWRKFAGEFAATFLLIFLGCATCIPIDGIDPMTPTYSPLGFGFVAMINVQTFGHISGAHMNPSITILAMVWRKISIVSGICYFIIQAVASIFASWVLMNVSPVDFAVEGVCTTVPHDRLLGWQAVVIEAILTATLCLITSALWDPVNEKKQDSVAIKFGLTIAGLSFAGGPLTGASMNPTRTLGPALVTGIWTAHWVYWVGPILGVVLACLYKFTWLEKPKQVSQ